MVNDKCKCIVSSGSFLFLGDVEEAYEVTKKIAENPHVEILKVWRLSSVLTDFLFVAVFKIVKFEIVGIILSIYGLRTRSTLLRNDRFVSKRRYSSGIPRKTLKM